MITICVLHSKFHLTTTTLEFFRPSWCVASTACCDICTVFDSFLIYFGLYETKLSQTIGVITLSRILRILLFLSFCACFRWFLVQYFNRYTKFSTWDNFIINISLNFKQTGQSISCQFFIGSFCNSSFFNKYGSFIST